MIKYRTFQISVKFLVFRYNSETRVFKIRNRLTHFLLSFWYSLITFMFGIITSFPTFPLSRFKKTMDALIVDLSGGIEYDKEMDELNYDEKTNFVWNNLLRTTIDKITKEELEIIIEIQEEYEDLGTKYTIENINYEYITSNRPLYHSQMSHQERAVNLT